MKSKGILSLLFSFGLLICTANAGIQISVVGDGAGYDILGTGAETHESTAYRSTGIPKNFDTDNDNIYGSAGLFMFGDGGAEINKQPFSMHTKVGASWASFFPADDLRGVAQSSLQGPMDDPAPAINAVVRDWGSVGTAVTTFGDCIGAWRKILTFKVSSDAPRKFRIGLVSGTQNQEDGRWDPAGLRITADGGKTYATVTKLENNGNGNPNWVFFDVDLNGATSGTFTIEGAQRYDMKEMGKINSYYTTGVSLTGVTFDPLGEARSLGLITALVWPGIPNIDAGRG
ncbi:hypothetical protein P4C99_08970 [Pontiellaceae bacterium B1224]|nr:hypothetical protein [Pontiellaceae bacterium B1224]